MSQKYICTNINTAIFCKTKLQNIAANFFKYQRMFKKFPQTSLGVFTTLTTDTTFSGPVCSSLLQEQILSVLVLIITE